MAELRERLTRIPEDDLEQQMEALRHFKLAHGLRVAASEQALQGEEVIIGKAGKPVVRLVPYDADPSPRELGAGAWKGQIWIADDFDELPEEVLAILQDLRPPLGARLGGADAGAGARRRPGPPVRGGDAQALERRAGGR